MTQGKNSVIDLFRKENQHHDLRSQPSKRNLQFRDEHFVKQVSVGSNILLKQEMTQTDVRAKQMLKEEIWRQVQREMSQKHIP